MKLRLSRLAPYGALMAVSLIQTFAFQASAQSSSEDPPHPMQQDSQPPSLASSLTQAKEGSQAASGQTMGSTWLRANFKRKSGYQDRRTLGRMLATP